MLCCCTINKKQGGVTAEYFVALTEDVKLCCSLKYLKKEKVVMNLYNYTSSRS